MKAIVVREFGSPDVMKVENAPEPVPGPGQVTIRVHAAGVNPTGAVTRNVFANDVRLIQNTTTPGNGDEPGYALTIAANGTISQ